MASSRCTHRVQFVVFVNLVIFFFAAAVVLYIIGGIMFGRENSAKATHKPFTCQVTSSNYYQSKCRGSRGSTYVCYVPVWTVAYSINRNDEEMRMNASIEVRGYRGSGDAQNKLDEYEIGRYYSCWCSVVDPSKARWNEPDPFNGMMILIFAGVATIFGLVGIFFSFRVRKKL